jgi:fibronectin-binding autotransporter adhesin
MKTKHLAALSAALSALALAPMAFGQLFYDSNNATGGTGANLVTNNWISSGGQANRVWATVSTGITGGGDSVHWSDNSTAIFAGTAGTVTVNGAVVAAAIDFQSSGYTVSGANTLTVTGNINVGTGLSATISAPLSGSVTKSGSGNLILGGTQSYSGSTTINGGRLTVSAPSALSANTNVTIAAGTTLALGTGGTYNTGSLSLPSGTATIDFNNITGSLNFGALTGSGSLNVINYAYSGSGSNFIKFTDVSSFTGTVFINSQLAYIVNGEISAIPEPSSFALFGALAALGWAGARRRRAVAA